MAEFGFYNTSTGPNRGGGITSTEASATSFFDGVTSAEALAGEEEYRAVYIKNISSATLHDVVVYISSQTPAGDDVSVALHPGGVGGIMAAIPDYYTAPTGVSFSAPSSQETGLEIGTMAPSEYCGLWIKRNVPASTGAYDDNSFTLTVFGLHTVGQTLAPVYNILSASDLTYGCVKPTTTSTRNNFRIEGDAWNGHTFSYEKFTGHVDKVGSYATTGIVTTRSRGKADCHDITFDHCVFATCDTTFASLPSGQGDAFHIINADGYKVYNITFDHCWFEPASRIQLEINGRGGWWHDITIDHCTFEAGLGEQLSCDMSPVNGAAVSPWGVTVDGVVRGVEGLVVTHNDFRGTGATVDGVKTLNGYTKTSSSGGDTTWTMLLELACVFPYELDEGIGRSNFSYNKVGRPYTAWFNFSYGGIAPVVSGHPHTYGMEFDHNVFDYSYNEGNVRAANYSPWGASVKCNYADWHDNTYTLSSTNNYPYYLLGESVSGANNTFENEVWTKAGTMTGTCSFPFTDTTYANCDFNLPHSVTFPTSASGTSCTFQAGHTGGTFT